MREFINEFGINNFIIIAVVILVILISLVIIVFLERHKEVKIKKDRIKGIIKQRNKKEKIENDQSKDNHQNKKNIIKEYDYSKALKGLENLEKTLEYTLDLEKKENNNEIKKSVSSNIEENKTINKEQKPRLTRVQKHNYDIEEDYDYDKNISYTNIKPEIKQQQADEVVYKENNITPEQAKEKLEEVTKKLIDEEPENDHVTIFEEEQEEKSIISYEELVRASKNVDETNDRLLEDEKQAAITLDELYKPKKEEKKSSYEKVPNKNKVGFTNSQVISPVFGRTNKEQKQEETYRNITEEDNEVFLEKLKSFRSKLN